MTMNHLTDDQFTALLLEDAAEGSAGAQLALHLEACEHCRRELSAVQSSMRSFNELGMAWARLEAPRRVRTPSRLALHLGLQPTWSAGIAGMTIAALMAVGLTSYNLRTDRVRLQSSTSVTPSNEEIAGDNQLLESISRELRYDASPVVSASDLEAPSRTRATHSQAPVMN